jgi:uncharacterized membrane protein
LGNIYEKDCIRGNGIGDDALFFDDYLYAWAGTFAIIFFVLFLVSTGYIILRNASLN